MPPPSPVWAWDFKEKKHVFADAEFRMRVKIGDAVYESNLVKLKVKGAEPPKK
jgi:hypothetical protein